MFEGEGPQQALPRALVLAPPACLLLASVIMLGAALAAWGAGKDVDLPPWMTTLAGLVLAAPALATGGITYLQIRERTRDDFEVDGLGLIVGGAWLLLAAGLVIMVALRLADGSTYDALRDEDGEVVVVPLAFLFFTIVGTFFFGVAMAPGAYLYSIAVRPGRPSRYERRATERDNLGEYFRGRGRYERYERERYGRSKW
jgi:hypothetical protein